MIEDNLQEIQREVQMNQMANLLNQSVSGHHILFDNEKIAQILQKPTEEMDFFKNENMEKIQQLFNDLMKYNSITKKLQFLQSLPNAEYEILVRTYFHILDNSLKVAKLNKH